MLRNFSVKYVSLASQLTRIALVLSYLAVLVLTIAMLYEVFARYLFSAPTIWAFDIAYMSNAAIFLLGNAWVLHQNGHIAIQLIYEKMPFAFRAVFDAIVHLIIVLPLFIFLSYNAVGRVFSAYTTQEVEMVSPWGPLMWPFYMIFAFGLVVFTIQIPASFINKYALNSTEV
ncbi:TRAP transporter small permease subunit [Pelistega suis]|uniref:TRAP transporter small permease subunit n=1 Tax=Pelistega suis TaxID=1631957 RepID=UPI00211C775A|nr:TRAP transporter small permease [Pelistega suis]MCQ9329589.1 TRAP transporter small permease [Pelistega suis]